MIDRRNFLSSVAGASLVPFSVSAAKRPDFASGKVEHCIHIWLGGGACQIDTWDPKIKGDPKLNKPGSDEGIGSAPRRYRRRDSLCVVQQK